MISPSAMWVTSNSAREICYTRLGVIKGAVDEIVGEGRKFLILGGEHLITYPILKALKTASKTFRSSISTPIAT